MATENVLFPTQLTDEERGLGFKLIETQNPEAHYGGAVPRMKAVVLMLSMSERIIKICDPMERGLPSGYKLQRFGVFRFAANDVPQWHPVGNAVHREPAIALRQAAKERGEDPPNDILPRNPDDYEGRQSNK